ncbi:hypothetical protein PRZ48_005643 [Zasmidium cellare]|uniref:Uncharacterized protein n=1 Tax=Zasmidium cellare TaxID=395010 RepID=A0ABR0ELY3_ZASCE|nr:hypothetical protein PRZ48_005643 [Zasmidium cellare]
MSNGPDSSHGKLLFQYDPILTTKKETYTQGDRTVSFWSLILGIELPVHADEWTAWTPPAGSTRVATEDVPAEELERLRKRQAEDGESGDQEAVCRIISDGVPTTMSTVASPTSGSPSATSGSTSAIYTGCQWEEDGNPDMQTGACPSASNFNPLLIRMRSLITSTAERSMPQDQCGLHRDRPSHWDRDLLRRPIIINRLGLVSFNANANSHTDPLDTHINRCPSILWFRHVADGTEQAPDRTAPGWDLDVDGETWTDCVFEVTGGEPSVRCEGMPEGVEWLVTPPGEDMPPECAEEGSDAYPIIWYASAVT